VSASIVTSTLHGIVVPTSAIVEDPQTGKTVVFVHDAHPKSGDPAFVLRTVRVRAGDDRTSVIGSGLRMGDRIAEQGGYMLLAPAGG
jgi:hypothetical protein